MDRANGAGSGAASRAERFEDEKRRIIDSCFNRADPDGSLLETYITHIRITEYSNSQVAPPPPQARTPDSQKPRVIIIAVKKTGKVRMHKSKENANGTFSIGKTWSLDDLSKIESYTSPSVDPVLREWAGEAGFAVTLGKPYFWHAPSEREKKFFIASLIKIYEKYTGGKVPSLVGFDAREHDMVLPAHRRQQGSRPSLSDQTNSIQSTASAATTSAVPSPGFSQSTASPPPRGIPPNGKSSPVGSIDSTRSQNQTTLRRLAGSNRSQDSVANSFATRSDDGGSVPPRSRNGMAVPPSFARANEQAEPQAPASEEKPPPERRRPPMDPTRQGLVDRDLVPAPLVPAPLASPGMKREPVPPPRSLDRALSGSGRKASLEKADTSSMKSAKEKAAYGDSPRGGFAEALASPSNGMKSPSNGSVYTDLASPSARSEDAAEPPPEPEESRPGLGPMIRSKKSKGELAGSLWKAAAAANAFKPRPGGAGERLRQLQSKSGEPDGITSVVPAPPRRVPTPEVARVKTPEPAKATERTSEVPEVKISVPGASRPTSLQSSSAPVVQTGSKDTNKTDEAARAKEEARRSIIVGNDAKYLSSLGVDPSVLDNRSEQFTHWLDFFGWVPGEKMRAKNTEEMKTDIERELNKAQAGGWLARFQEEDERVNAIKKGLDVAMTECEELDNLLTLYSVELSTLSDDIAYIEAQGQGLQVQAANQKLLKTELESLLKICAITSDDLDALRDGRLDKVAGLEAIENALVTLFKAMTKIDPSLLGGEMRKMDDVAMETEQSAGLLSDYGKMRIVQEKQQMYMQESSYFVQRLVDFMTGQFDSACVETKRSMDGALSRKVDPRHHDAGRDLLWMYSPMMLYARDVDLDNWNRLIQIYQDKNNPMYRVEFRDIVEAWKRNARKSTAEDSELLFTFQPEKPAEGIASTAARKLTVKKSQNLSRSARSPLLDSSSKSADRSGGDGRTLPYDIFGGVLDDLLPLVEMEQNFIIDFFHATTLEQMDFPESVSYTRPQERRGGDLKRHRLMEPDRELARRVTRSMEVIYSFLEADLTRLMEWVLGNSQLQGIGVLAILDRKLVDMSQSNQDFLNGVLQRLHGTLEGKLLKFVDGQVKAIEESKISVQKRRGVIQFVRVFPTFSAAVENMMEGVDANLGVRRTIDGEYERILKAIFNKLKAIARDSSAGAGAGAGAGSSVESEDKEALNFHILLIENMNHFLEETDGRGLGVLEEWRETAARDLAEHMSLYLGAVMRRPLGKLLDYVENIEAQLQSGKSGAAISAQPSNSKMVFNKVLGQYDGKEVRKGVEALKKRVEKHFGDADEPGSSRNLVNRVLRECERFYGEVDVRIGNITTNVYGGETLYEWPRGEAKNAFGLGGGRFL